MAMLEGDFSIQYTEHAIIVRGSMPCDAMSGIKVMADERGYEMLDINMAATHGAIMVLTDAAGSAAMRAEHDASISHLCGITRWLAGWDRGVSSMTIYRAITGDARHLGFGQHTSVPRDDDDFGRCVRLLDAAPELRKSLPLVSQKHPDWGPLIDRWDELEALHRNGERRAVNRLLVELRSLEATP